MSVPTDAGMTIELPVGQAQIPSTALADRFLHVVLYVTVLSSFYVVIEPAPYEYLSAVLAFACVLARVSINRLVLPLLVLLLIRDAGGAIGLFQILDHGYMRLSGEPYPLFADFEYPDSIRFLATSFYLGLSAVMVACICAQDSMRRIATLRSAYIMAAVTASVLGTLGYFDFTFNFLPGLDFFTLYGRATGGFKGPNDLGGYLIAPLMWLIQGFIVDKIRPHALLASIIIFIGLLLSFSRGAWTTSLFSGVMMIYFLYVTQNNRRSHNRIIFCVVGGIVAAIAIFTLLASIDAVSHMFAERARLQDYDVNGNNRSRVELHELSFAEMLIHPLGMGPWGFAHATNIVSHNVYLGTMLNHGWLGGAAYLTIIALTLTLGFRAFWLRTPWQAFLIATYLSFVAMLFEGTWGDTDHWRHFYILLGIVWGLVAATQKAVWREYARVYLDQTGLLKPGMHPFQRSLEKPT